MSAAERGLAVSGDAAQDMPAAVALKLDFEAWGAVLDHAAPQFKRQRGSETGHEIPDDAALILCPGGCDDLASGLAIPDPDKTAERNPGRDSGIAVAAPDAENGVGSVLGHCTCDELALKGSEGNRLSSFRAFRDAKSMLEFIARSAGVPSSP